MDCQALLKYCGGIKSPILPNATLHFISTQLFGPHYFHHLVQFSKATRIPTEQRLHKFLPMLMAYLNTYNWKAQNIKDHLSKTAAEYLLNPWLLIQLPWNAALLNQWLIAALAEVLMVKKELVRFRCWPIGADLISFLNIILTRVEVLHCKLLTGFGFVGLCTKSTIEPDVSQATLIHLLLPVLPTLEMLVNKKLYTIIESLKKYAWRWEGQYVILLPTSYEFTVLGACSELDSIDDESTAYGFKFWMTCNHSFPLFKYIKSDSLEVLVNYFKGITENCSVQHSNVTELYEDFLKNVKEGADLEWCEYVWKKHHKEIILIVKGIVTKEVGEINKDFDFETFSFEKNNNYLFFASLFTCYEMLTDFSEGVTQYETNAILNINHLQTELMVAEIEAQISAFVYTDLKKEGRHVYLRTPSTITERVDLFCLFDDYEQSIPEAWTVETLKMKLPEACKAPINCREAYPYIEVFGHKKVMQIFEVNIINKRVSLF